MQWDDSLAAMAQRYAEKLVEIDKNSPKVELVHERSRRRFGENLYRSDGKEKANCIDASLTLFIFLPKRRNFPMNETKATPCYLTLNWQ